MKIITKLVFVLIIFSSFLKLNNVYICDSPKAIAYHSSKTCKGLNRCNHGIIEVTEKKAKEIYKRRKCKLCY